MDLTQLSDDALLHGFATLVAQDRRTTAALLAHIAEIDARHLYLRAGFESMRAYCMREIHLSEDAAITRITVARLARQLPALFLAIADGRLHLTAVRLLAPRLNAANVAEWIAAAANRSLGEIGVLLAHRYPQAESLRLDDGIAPQVVVVQPAGANSHVLKRASGTPQQMLDESLPAGATPVPVAVEVAPRVRTRIAPLSPERYTLQVTLPGGTHDKLRRVQALLGHAVPSGDVAQVLDRALDALLLQLEKRKFGLAEQPRVSRPVANIRCIPARVRRAVYIRDAGRCAFVGQNRVRCNATSRLEFDHVVPVAHGGRSTAGNLRLLCRAHNRYEAERILGREVMESMAAR